MRTVITGLAVVLIAVSTAFAQPPEGGGERGSRGGFGGGPPAGGFPGGSRGAPSGMTFGDRGSRGGAPGGGFNPADMIRRFDRNGNNMIDPDESQGPAQFFLQRLAQSNPKIDLSKPVPIDLLTGEIDKMRGGAPSEDDSSDSNSEPQPLVPNFSLSVTPEPVAGFGASSAMFNVKISDRDLKDAEERVRRYDSDKDGVLSAEEIRRGRWYDDPLQYDRNRDGKLTASELAVRSAKRRIDEEAKQASNNTASRSRGGAPGTGWMRSDNNGDNAPKKEESRFGDAKSYRMASASEALNGVKGLPDFFARSDADGDGQVLMSEFSTAWNADTLNEFLKWDLNSDGIITSRECLASIEGGTRVSGSSASTSTVTSSGVKPSTSDNSDAVNLDWAKRQIARYDKNGDNQLTAKEWDAMLVKPDGADSDKDGVITAEEYAAFRSKK